MIQHITHRFHLYNSTYSLNRIFTLGQNERHFSSIKHNPLGLNLHQVKSLLESKEITSKYLIETAIKRLSDLQTKHKLNAAIPTNRNQEELAIRSAMQKDTELNSDGSRRGKLSGIPIAVKDNFCTKDFPTTCSSKMLFNFNSPYNATVVEQLKKEGAVLISKTNMDEFAMGSTSTLSYFGPVINPWSKSVSEARVAGGSSGGSAALVAGRACFAAIGSDTGGSVRQPAAYCGVVGLKPTYGRVSRYGLVAYASSLDTPGIFARNVADSALVLEAIAGYDSRDSTSVNTPVPTYSKDLDTNISGLTIGIPKEYFVDELSSEILELWKYGAEKLASVGVQIREISLPHTKYALPAYYIIAPAEATSNLSRYDGVRYGHRSDVMESYEDMYSQTRSEGFGEEVKRRILLGNFVLSRTSYESYYKKAQQIRRLILEDFVSAFRSGVDVILTPTTPTAAFLISDSNKLDPVSLYINDVMTIPASLAGLPAISVPVKLSNEKLPLGLQLIGQSMQEQTLLNVASVLESKEIENTIPTLLSE